MRFVAIVCVLCLFVPSTIAWGNTGHEIVGSIAQALLNTGASNQVGSILNGATLESVATWADSVKRSPGYEWSGVLHYVDIQDWACNYVPSRDCADKNCVTGALYNYTSRTGSTSIDPTQRNEALKFLTHFAGDVHQPLHAGFVGDEGGNKLEGKYEGKSTNLHAIWDEGIITTRLANDFGGDQTQYTNWLIQQIQGPWANNASSWATCGSSPSQYVCPDGWATESAGLACTQAYVDQTGAQIQNGFTLGDDYYNFNSGIVDMQLAKGGVRLASTLNKLFSSEDIDSNLDAILRAFDSTLESELESLPSN
jgi:hypothetical protein